MGYLNRLEYRIIVCEIGRVIVCPKNVYSESWPYHTLHRIVLGETLIEYVEYSSAGWNGGVRWVAGVARRFKRVFNSCRVINPLYPAQYLYTAGRFPIGPTSFRWPGIRAI